MSQTTYPRVADDWSSIDALHAGSRLFSTCTANCGYERNVLSHVAAFRSHGKRMFFRRIACIPTPTTSRTLVLCFFFHNDGVSNTVSELYSEHTSSLHAHPVPSAITTPSSTSLTQPSYGTPNLLYHQIMSSQPNPPHRPSH
jgi:hypothetical protein